MGKLIKRLLLPVIKKRVLKVTQQFGDYETATSYIINAPLEQWRLRLWIVENIHYENGLPCTDESVYEWLTRR